MAIAIKESFPLGDLAFEALDGGITLILPDTDMDQALRVMEALRSKAASAPAGAKTCTLSIGITSRGGRLVEGSTLVEESHTAARKAAREGGNRVIGFRADPALFREALSVSPG